MRGRTSTALRWLAEQRLILDVPGLGRRVIMARVYERLEALGFSAPGTPPRTGGSAASHPAMLADELAPSVDQLPTPSPSPLS